VCRCSVKRHPDAFTFPELAQLTSAYRAMGFRNDKLTAQIERNVLALPEYDLMAATAVNLIRDLAFLGYREAEVYQRLVRSSAHFGAASCAGGGVMASC
jgi:hypothetical protein